MTERWETNGDKWRQMETNGHKWRQDVQCSTDVPSCSTDVPSCSMLFHEVEEGKARPYACFASRQDLGKMHAQIAKEEMLKVWKM